MTRIANAAGKGSAALLVACSAALPALAQDLRFRPAPDKSFVFDTGMLRGKLRAGGKSTGLADVVHIPTGKTISHGYGLVGHYRVFAANHRYKPDAWYLASEARLTADGAVEVYWAPQPERPFAMWAVYRWSGPNALDIETRVRADAPIKAFESFLASYFAPPFITSRAWAKSARPALVEADESSGVWQMFPRNPAAVRLIQDGRWKHPPSPVDWRIRSRLARPLAVRRDPDSGLAAIVMAPTSDCFAVSTPHQKEGHRSLYLSLFGRDLKAGATASAAARLVIGIYQTDKEILAAWDDFAAARKKARGR